MKHFFRVLRYIKPYLPQMWLNIGFNLLYVFFSLFSLTMVVPFLGLLFGTQERVYEKPDFALNSDAVSDYLYYYITRIIENYGEDQALAFICLLVATAFFLRNLCRYFASFFLSPIRHGVIRDMRNDLYHKIVHMPLSYFSTNRKGDIMSRMTSDVTGVQQSIMASLVMVVRDPLTIIAYLTTLIIMSPQLTLIVAVLFPISGIVIGKIGKSLKRSSRKTQRKMADVVSHLEEVLGGLRIVKGFSAEDQVEGRFRAENDVLRRISIRLLRKKDLSSPVSEFLSTIVMVVVMWIGGRLVLETGEINPQTFIGYIIIFSQIIPSAKALTNAYYDIQKGNASAERIMEILDAENHIVNRLDAKPLSDFQQEIHMDKVRFAYQETTVIDGVDIRVPKGKTIALVGPSGSGKSTLADLVCRFYEVQEGSVRIDGMDVKDVDMHDLRKLMGIVSQESILFNDSVVNNITLGAEHVDMDRVKEAAKIANAHGFIEALDKGYETLVGERGTKLSGGQRQRLSIARAIYKNPPILILDEATSALDTESEKLVQEAIEELMKNRTSLVIAHRLSTIKNADEIVVLDQGRVVERGTHQDLYNQGGLYRKLCDMQSFES